MFLFKRRRLNVLLIGTVVLLVQGALLHLRFFAKDDTTTAEATNDRMIFHHHAVEVDVIMTKHIQSLNLREAYDRCKQRNRNKETNGNGRDFAKFPIKVGSPDFGQIEKVNCGVPCFHYPVKRPASFHDSNSSIWPSRFDASFSGSGDFSILRTMEAASYYHNTELETAKRNFGIVMTTRLDSDVPVPYFSWVIFNFMKTPKPLTEKKKEPLASAFISNCHATNFRLEAVRKFQNLTPPIGDFFGKCFGGRSSERKEDAMAGYKFHFAFENSIEKDYVTEKYFQCLDAGTVPVVIGAPNIRDFEPGDNSLLVVSSLSDVEPIAAKMRQLGQDDVAYAKMLSWKKTGPSRKFKAVTDLAVVHSNCRLCIHVADKIRFREQENNTDECFCSTLKAVNDSESTIFKVHVRERGLFNFLDVYLTGKETWDINAFQGAVLNAFKMTSPDGYWPIWTVERDETGRRPSKDFFQKRAPFLDVYRIYEVGKTQRDVLYGDEAIDSNFKLAKLFYNNSNKCLYLEVIFV